METALAGQAAITPDGTAPKAYLNYIFLHKNFNPGNTTTGFERLPSGALNNYQLMQKEIPIDQEGFLYIFVANESPFDQGVWFDDFKVEVTVNPASEVAGLDQLKKLVQPFILTGSCRELKKSKNLSHIKKLSGDYKIWNFWKMIKRRSLIVSFLMTGLISVTIHRDKNCSILSSSSGVIWL